jgi:hypothetical protein
MRGSDVKLRMRRIFANSMCIPGGIMKYPVESKSEIEIPSEVKYHEVVNSDETYQILKLYKYNYWGMHE